MSQPPADNIAVSVEGVSKSFRLPQEQVHTLKERVLHPARRRRFDVNHALDDVSFEVRQGEFFGIVGRNGSGKSTLMKCLSGIHKTDAGEMWLRGRMAPFIELGVGFNPDLTAHDNVLLNAVMLGLTPAQARKRYQSILEFADLERFADLKLKNYSSGMQVRLAFSVMTHVDADLLLIDEVLAVGDAAFQQKCYDVLNRARAEGRTILLVTHDMDQVQRFCDRAMLLDSGRLMAIGDPGSVARRYLQLNFSRGADVQTVQAIIASGEGDGRAMIVDAWVQDLGGRTEVLEHRAVTNLCMRVRFAQDTEEPVFGLALSDEQHRRVFAANTEWSGEPTGAFTAGDEIDVVVAFENWFTPGRYYLTPQVTHPGGQRIMAAREDIASFVVTGTRASGGVVEIPHSFHITPASMASLTPQRH